MRAPRWPADSSRPIRPAAPRPQLGVVERPGDFEVVAELPSGRPEDVSVQLERGALTIRARRAEPPARPGDPAGWQVSLAFGDLVRGDARVVLQDSILLVTLPKAHGAAPAPSLEDVLDALAPEADAGALDALGSLAEALDAEELDGEELDGEELDESADASGDDPWRGEAFDPDDDAFDDRRGPDAP